MSLVCSVDYFGNNIFLLFYPCHAFVARTRLLIPFFKVVAILKFYV